MVADQHRPGRSQPLPCRADPELFFRNDEAAVAEAKLICGGCPFLEECRWEAAATDSEYGTWGGLSESERRATRSARQTHRSVA